MSKGSASVTALVPLPRFYNSDEHGNRELVEDDKFEHTAEEIAKQFGGGTLYLPAENSPRGFWWDRGFVDRDVLALLEVDMPDTAENRAWLKSYAKEVLLERFRQKGIYIKFVGPVDTLLVTREEVTSAVKGTSLLFARLLTFYRKLVSILRGGYKCYGTREKDPGTGYTVCDHRDRAA